MEGIDTESMEVPKTRIQDLPVEVRDYLMSFLDYSSRRTCRLVSHNLKESADGVGISIKIDSRRPKSLELCKSATEVQAQYMLPSCPVENLNLRRWRTVVLSGPIGSDWLTTGLQRNCPNLRVLIFSGDCLTSQDFDGPLDLPIFEHLTQLQCTTKGRWTTFDQRCVDRNMLYLLKSIRSRVLRVLELFVCISPRTSHSLVYPSLPSWQHKPLFDFIENHRNSLEELNATNLGILLNQQQRHLWVQFNEEQTVFKMPTKLKQFCWRVEESYNVVLSSFWRDLLLSQESLERISLEFSDPVLFPLGRILFTNARTLKCIILHLDKTPVLDMSLFSNLGVLQMITVNSSTDESPRTSVINLNRLPRTRLTSLKLCCVEIEESFDAIEFMDGCKLDTLKFKYVSTTLGPLSSRHYLKNFVKLALRCRSLNVLHFTFLPRATSTAKLDYRSLTSLQEKVGLNLWLSNLSAQGPMNHFCTQLDISDIHDIPYFQQIRNQDFPAADWMEYREQSGGANVEYLELIAKKNTRYSLGQNQEQPFNFPRNAESYTISKFIPEYSRFRILPNFQSYTMRVQDIGRLRITVQFYCEESIFQPVSLKDLESDIFV